MDQLQVDVRQHGPLARRTDAITQEDVFERLLRPTSRSREFRDAITRVDGALPGIPMQAKEWGRWTP